MRWIVRAPVFSSWIVVSILALGAARGAAQPVGQNSGPLSEISRPIGEGRPVSSGRGPTLGESSAPAFNSPPVTGSSVGSMISGSVSDISAGPVSETRPMTQGGGSMTDNSAGAVKKDLASPLGERISDPIHELAPLQARLRELQQQLTQPESEMLIGQVAEEENVPIDEEVLDDGGGGGEEVAPQHDAGEDVAPQQADDAHPEDAPPADEAVHDEAEHEEVDDAPEEPAAEEPAVRGEGEAAPPAHDDGSAPAAAGEEDLPGDGF